LSVSLRSVGFHFRFGFDVERLFVVIGFLDLRRIGRPAPPAVPGGFQVCTVAAIDDERLLAA